MSHPIDTSNLVQKGRVILVYRMLTFRCALLAVSLSGSMFAATFGTVVPLTGGASDLALDEARSKLYLVNTNLTEIDIYSIAQKRFLTPIKTDATPVAAAMSRDGKFLYVTCNSASALDVINLDTTTLVSRVSLVAKPEGVAVGNDGRVLISTTGTGSGTTLANVLLLYNPADGSVNNVIVTPAAPQSPLLPSAVTRPALAVRSQLRATPDGSLIVGVNIVSGTGATGTGRPSYRQVPRATSQFDGVRVRSSGPQP